MLGRLSSPALLVALALVALPACGTSERAADTPTDAAEVPRPLSARELGWIRGYSALADSLYDGSLTATTSGKRPCLDRLAKTGRPPTARLRPAHRAAREICEKLASGGVYGAEKLVDETDERLGRLFLTSRPLRVARSPDDASHVDLTLGELASHLAGESVEVRCWSPRDWRRLIVEENAWDVTEEDPQDIDGLAETDDGQMHLLLADCNLLARLRHEDVTERRGEDLIDATHAVSILAHEIGHFAEPEADEAAVECSVPRHLRGLADGLDLDATELDRLMRAYRAHVRPDLPDEYLRECGG